MTASGCAFFDTEIGLCGIAWNPRGIAGLQLPEGTPKATRARLARRFPEVSEQSAPPDVEETVAGIVALLRGDAADLSSVVLDMDGIPEFDRRVYAVARTIPPGATLSYGEIAARLGEPDTARAVGQALGRNPFPIVVPCHRVLAAGGRTGGFSANGGTRAKRRLLAIEGARLKETPGLFDDFDAFGRARAKSL